MSSAAAFTELLACPRCDRAPLASRPDGYHCAACRVDFPDLAGVPWLFSEPNASRDEWRQRFGLLLRRFEQDDARLAAALAGPALLPATRHRLEQLRTAKTEHSQQLLALLEPLLAQRPAASYETYLALRTRLPPDQGIANYYANIHRDWCWGEIENRAALQLIQSCAGPDPALGTTAVLGAGAGRLAYDLHAGGHSTVTIALDINPLLVLTAQRMSRGEALDFYEFPLAPRGPGDQAVLRRLQAPAPAPEGLFHVLADALRVPIAAGSLDCVVTPWFVDIVSEEFGQLAARINRLLRRGGRWINFGSLSFHDSDPARHYGLDECLTLMQQNGFDAADTRETEIPYMCSPASRHGRRETVVSWSARKLEQARRPPKPIALPDWLVRGDSPVPNLPAFQSQALSTRIHAFLMSQIDGRRSLRAIAQALVAQGLMGEAEAESALRSFLIKMYEDAQRPISY
jgi:hypothetical protein